MTKKERMLTQNDADFLGLAIGWTIGIAVLMPLFIEIILMILDEIKERKRRKRWK